MGYDRITIAFTVQLASAVWVEKSHETWKQLMHQRTTPHDLTP